MGRHLSDIQGRNGSIPFGGTMEELKQFLIQQHITWCEEADKAREVANRTNELFDKERWFYCEGICNGIARVWNRFFSESIMNYHEEVTG